MTDTEGRI